MADHRGRMDTFWLLGRRCFRAWRQARLRSSERFARKEGGQSLVEFAIGVSLLLLLLAGVVDLGRGFYSYVVIANAAREGARYGASYPEGDIVGKVIAEAQDSGIALTAGDVSVTLTDPPKGFPVRVDVHHEFEPWVGAILDFLGLPGGKINLNTSAQMMVM